MISATKSLGRGGNSVSKQRGPAGVWSQYDPGQYVSDFYASGVTADERLAIKYQIEFMKRNGPWEKAVEVGCGPTVFRAIAAAPYVGSIDLEDVNARALECVKSWKAAEANAHDWRSFTAYALECEGAPQSINALEAREQLARKVIREVRVSDILSPSKDGSDTNAQYDFLLSGYCVECVGHELSQWQRALHSSMSRLKRRGAIFLICLWGCDSCRVGRDWYPCHRVTPDNLFEALAQGDCLTSSIDIQSYSDSTFETFGWDGMILATGIKG